MVVDVDVRLVVVVEMRVDVDEGLVEIRLKRFKLEKVRMAGTMTWRGNCDARSRVGR